MRISRFLAVFAMLLIPAAADAACVTGFSASATPLGFGVYMPGALAATTSSSTIKVNCLVGLLPAFTVSLSAGSGTFAQRKMTQAPAATLAYNIYLDAGHSRIWGDGTGGTFVQEFSGLLSLLSTSYTAFGSIDPGQYAAAGAYSDTIVVTLSF
jgi:spore coat protein U-like protein